MEASQYTSVSFRQVAETYPVDASVECQFTLSDSVKASKWDWVGLFRVGWCRQREYLTYVYAPLPPDYQPGTSADNAVVFQASTLPKDDGEFFQFCYVSADSGTICGVSAPFQFRAPGAVDLVEEEDGDMLVIRPRTHAMQDRIQSLEHTLILLREELKESHLEKCRLFEQVAHQQTELADVKEMYQRALKEKEAILALEAQKIAECEKLLRGESDLRCRAETKRDQAVKALRAEVDNLSGFTQGLQDEMDSYKLQVTDWQTVAAGRTKETEAVRQELDEVKAALSQQVEEAKVARSALENELKDMVDQHARLQQISDSQMEELKQNAARAQSRLTEVEGQRAKVEEQAAKSQKEAQRLFLLTEELGRRVDEEKAKASQYAICLMESAIRAEQGLEPNACPESLPGIVNSICQQKREAEKVAAELAKEVEEARTNSKLLQDELDNANDKLLACEEVREKLQGTVKAYEATQLQINAKIEKQTSLVFEMKEVVRRRREEAEGLRQQSSQLTAALHAANTTCDDLNSQLQAKHTQVELLQQELTAAQESDSRGEDSVRLADALQENRQLRERLEALTQEAGAQYALTSASAALQTRLEDRERELQALRVEKQMVKVERDDLEQRLHLAGEEFAKVMRREAKLRRRLARIHIKTTDTPAASFPEAQTDSHHKCPLAGEDFHPMETRPVAVLKGHPEGTTLMQKVREVSLQGQAESRHELTSESKPSGSAVDPACGEVDVLGSGAEGQGSLPRPLQPEVMPEAKLAAVRRQINCSGSSHDSDVDDGHRDEVFEDCQGDELFEDAVTDLVQCADCQAGDMSRQAYEEHVAWHFGRICPVCRNQADEAMTQANFEYHVNRCLDSDGQA